MSVAQIAEPAARHAEFALEGFVFLKELAVESEHWLHDELASRDCDEHLLLAARIAVTQALARASKVHIQELARMLREREECE
jgi:hypothetical protein